MNRGMMMSAAAVLLVAGGVGMTLFTGAGHSSDGRILPYDDARVVAQGEAIYADMCAACHGADLRGEANWREPDEDGYLPAPPHDPSGHTWHHPDAQLIDITTRGTEAVVGRGYKSRMPGFGDQLEPDDIVAVLAYIKSRWPQRVIEAHNEINLRAAGQN